jgi:hypothetical protein
VAVDTSTDTAADVDRAFRGEVEIREVHNDGRQEMTSFPWLMERLIDDSNDLTFYCHAKGCTHRENNASHLWCDAMASACLDYPGLVDWCMDRKSICGAFRSRLQVGFSHALWHFAGTWWWVRNRDLFTRDWQRSDPEFWGAESYPGLHFLPTESACVFFDNAGTHHLYSVEWWRDVICPAYKNWRAGFDVRGITPLATEPPLWPDFRRWTT